MKKLILMITFFVSLSTFALSDNYTVNNGNGASCSSSESSGRSVEYSLDTIDLMDLGGDQGIKAGVKFKFELGKGKLKRVNCNRLFDISVQKEQLELDRAKLQIELLKAQLEAVKNGTADANSIQSTGSDW